MSKPVVYTFSERPSSMVERLRNGKFRVFVNITEEDEVIEHNAIDDDDVDSSSHQHADESLQSTTHVFRCEAVEVPVLDYPAIVSAIVRSHYTSDEIEAIILNGADTDEHKDEYEALQEWRRTAKGVARKIVDGE